MDQEDQYSPEQSDITPALPLEISADLAASVDDVLQDFAEGAELETALVVERSGALVSGISSEAEVMVEIISALVAGASAAMNALVKELGSTGNIESFHQSEERAVYLAEIMDRFVLVGVSTVPVPVGVIREKARRVRPDLIELLQGIEVSPTVVPAAPQRTYSLRDMALTHVQKTPPDLQDDTMPVVEEQAAAPTEPVQPAEESSVESIFFDDDDAATEPVVEETAVEEGPVAADDGLESIFEAVDEEEVVEEPEPVTAAVEEVPVEPTEVIEYLDDDSPEIVIEDSTGDVIDSPFETEEEDEIDEETAPAESIFELEEGEDDEIEEQVPSETDVPEEEAPVFEIEPEESEEVFEIDDTDSAETSPVFEVSEEDEDSDNDDETFELDFDDFEEDAAEESDADPEGSTDGVEAEEKVVVSDNEEEEEASSSGPFYF